MYEFDLLYYSLSSARIFFQKDKSVQEEGSVKSDGSFTGSQPVGLGLPDLRAPPGVPGFGMNSPGVRSPFTQMFIARLFVSGPALSSFWQP
ncbi:hypothetical protein C0J52_05889 [Blattella germanica]|nr:hypothetical protein C0J52_05889 [Blattella germanica]